MKKPCKIRINVEVMVLVWLIGLSIVNFSAFAGMYDGREDSYQNQKYKPGEIIVKFKSNAVSFFHGGEEAEVNEVIFYSNLLKPFSISSNSLLITFWRSFLVLARYRLLTKRNFKI